MNFFTTLANALYSKGYVVRFSGRSFGQMAGYLFRLFLIESVIIIGLGLIGGSSFITQLNSGSFIDDYYPENLEIQITNGEVTTNVEQPYLIRDSKALVSGSTTPDVFAVIDTTATDTIATIEKYKASVLLTHNALVAQKSDGEIRVIPLTDVKDFHLDRSVVHSFYLKALPYVYVIGVFMGIVIPLAFALFLTLFEMLSLLLGGCIVLAVASMRKVTLTYGEAYVLSGYLATFPILVGIAIYLLHLHESALIDLLLFAAVAILNIRQSQELTTVDNPKKDI